nr:DUF3265 domain-containing protein [Vibrio owensii]
MYINRNKTHIKLTNCSRVIRNAWHSHYALSLVFKVVLVGFIHSLTRS